MLYGFADSLKVAIEVLIVLERSVSFCVESLQTVLDLLISTFLEEEVLRKEKDRNVSNPIVKHNLESLNTEDKSAGTARYSTTKKLFLQ